MTPTFGTFEEPLADHYRFESELGRGGMGTVYRALDLRLGRHVAIKLLDPALTNDVGVARFQSEIRIAAGLRHTHIVALHEAGEAAGHLFYVMDLADGETLRAKIKRERQLSVDDALAITADVADALQYAHDHGVVHRDIKPENIILSDGHACVVDFGLARALGSVDADRLTASGLAVGTPHYLSPEQASAEKDVGPRADQYALACVLYEMLAGEPPFTGPTASSIAMRHISSTAVPLRSRRAKVPRSVEVAVNRALEKVPADRFARVADFAHAIRVSDRVSQARTSLAQRVGPRGRRRLAMGLLLAAVAGTVMIVFAKSQAPAADVLDDGVRWLTKRSIDTTRFVVFPSMAPNGAAGDRNLDEGLRGALARWTGISVAGGNDVQSALDANPSEKFTAGRARGVARGLRAGRYVTVELTNTGATRQVRVDIHDAKSAAPPRTVRTTLPSDAVMDSALANLAYAILFPGDDAENHIDESRGTRSRTAFALFLRAKAAERTWNLPLADSSYAAALRLDEAFPQALLGLAQVRSWARDDAPEVKGLVSRALDGYQQLSPTTQMHASALSDLGSGHYPDACARYDSLVTRTRGDFAAWLGVSECNRLDNAVVPSRASPTGRKFRGSAHRSITAVRRAFDQLPSLDACCVRRAVELLRRPLRITATTVRTGRSTGPDSGWYAASPELIGDTIGFVPVALHDLSKEPPRSNAAAIERQRDAMLSMATQLAGQLRGNPDALEFLGEALDLRASKAALDTIRRALSLTNAPDQRLRLSVSELWMLVKRAVPGDLVTLRRARQLADSLLAHAPSATPADAALLASLAALTGDANRAAALAQIVDVNASDEQVPPKVRGSAWSLLAYAAMGGPVDSLRGLEARVASEISNTLAPELQAIARSMALGRAAMLAFPSYQSSVLLELDTLDAKIAAEIAYMRHDKTLVGKKLDEMARARAHMRPGDLTLDALYPQAWLYAAIGDTSGALRTIGRTLDALPAIPAKQLASAVIAGTLMQSMMLRAELLAASGARDSSRQWARATEALTNSMYLRGPQPRGRVQRLLR